MSTLMLTYLASLFSSFPQKSPSSYLSDYLTVKWRLLIYLRSNIFLYQMPCVHSLHLVFMVYLQVEYIDLCWKYFALKMHLRREIFSFNKWKTIILTFIEKFQAIEIVKLPFLFHSWFIIYLAMIKSYSFFFPLWEWNGKHNDRRLLPPAV